MFTRAAWPAVAGFAAHSATTRRPWNSNTVRAPPRVVLTATSAPGCSNAVTKVTVEVALTGSEGWGRRSGQPGAAGALESPRHVSAVPESGEGGAAPTRRLD